MRFPFFTSLPDRLLLGWLDEKAFPLNEEGTQTICSFLAQRGLNYSCKDDEERYQIANAIRSLALRRPDKGFEALPSRYLLAWLERSIAPFRTHALFGLLVLGDPRAIDLARRLLNSGSGDENFRLVASLILSQSLPWWSLRRRLKARALRPVFERIMRRYSRLSVAFTISLG